MPKNLSRYYQAWKLRQQGKKLREIGAIMGFGVERTRFLVKYVNFIIQVKPYRISNDLKELVRKCAAYIVR
jgi:hypothetical protein